MENDLNSKATPVPIPAPDQPGRVARRCGPGESRGDDRFRFAGDFRRKPATSRGEARASGTSNTARRSCTSAGAPLVPRSRSWNRRRRRSTASGARGPLSTTRASRRASHRARPPNGREGEALHGRGGTQTGQSSRMARALDDQKLTRGALHGAEIDMKIRRTRRSACREYGKSTRRCGRR